MGDNEAYDALVRENDVTVALQHRADSLVAARVEIEQGQAISADLARRAEAAEAKLSALQEQSKANAEGWVREERKAQEFFNQLSALQEAVREKAGRWIKESQVITPDYAGTIQLNERNRRGTELLALVPSPDTKKAGQ